MPAYAPEFVKARNDMYMPRISLINSKMTDLSIPSLAVRTSAKHKLDGKTFPAGVLIWG